MINSPASSLTSYFVKLAGHGSELLNRLPIEREPQPLEYALNRLSPALDEIKEQEIAAIEKIGKPETKGHVENQLGVGLNSIGMLADRFTILIIREWCLRNKGARDIAKADALFQEQSMDIIAAMAQARPGSSSMNSKITNIKGDAMATSWSAAFYGLLATNLILWESQEILYIQDIQKLPAEELRSYIKWFSYGNIRRNEYIQLCESFYWQKD